MIMINVNCGEISGRPLNPAAIAPAMSVTRNLTTRPGSVMAVFAALDNRLFTNAQVAQTIKEPTNIKNISRPDISDSNSITVNPFRESLVTGISKPNRLGLTTPISIDPMSMHRHAIGQQSMLRTPHKPGIYASNVRVGRVFKSFVSQAHGLIEKGFMVHGRIIGGSVRRWHSYFPWWIAMPTSSLFLPNGGHPKASESFGGIRK